MFNLPTSITINGQPYGITNKGDYRMVIDCFLVLNDIELTEEERIISALLIFYDDVNSPDDISTIFDKEVFPEAVKQMYRFFNCNQKEIGAATNHKLVDWEQDEQLIVSAINNVAKTEVRAVDYMHWFTFMGYYTSVGESVLSTVISIRDKIVKGKKLEDYEKEFRNANPGYFEWNHKTIEELEADKELEAILANWHSKEE